jgi:hypothetical protein
MISDKKYQSASQVIRIKGVKTSTEYTLNFALKKAIVQHAKHLPAIYSSLSVIPGSLHDQQVDLKLPLATPITDQKNITQELELEVAHILPELITILRMTESLAQAEIEKVFPLPGIRVQERPLGKCLLTEHDVLNCTQPDDGIALGTWPVEEWDYNGKVKLKYFPENDAYGISARSLMSTHFENLFFAGKGISAEASAIASARVTGTCLQTGYAAGKIAAAKTSSEREAVIKNINVMISAIA